jgi:phytol kinase
MPEWLGALLVGSGFLALIAIAEAWFRLRAPAVEHTRKLVHFGSGFGCAVLPLLVQSHWTVLALAVSFVSFFAVTKAKGWLPSLHRIDRKSRGSEYYPLAIYLLFVLAADNIGIYVASVLVLAIGDACAALVGANYGVCIYEVDGNKKSVEGSLVLAVITFLAVHLPLVLLTDLAPVHTVLIAINVAAVVTLLEGISLSGADNLFVPLCAAFMMLRQVQEPVLEIAFQGCSMVAIFAFVLLVNRRGRWFNAGGVMGASLGIFCAWAVGGWLAGLPMQLSLLLALPNRLRAGPGHAHRVKVRYLAGMLLPPTFFLVVGTSAHALDALYGPFLVAFCVGACFWVREQVRWKIGERPLWTDLGHIARTFVVIAVPPWLLQAERSAAALLISLAVVLASVLGERFVTRTFRWEPETARWTARRFNFAVAAGLLLLLLQTTGVAPHWAPQSAIVNPRHLFWPGAPYSPYEARLHEARTSL